MSRWPHRTLFSVPPSHIAEDLAMEVRRSVFQNEDPETIRCDLRMICAAGGFSPRVVTMAVNGKKHEAFLVPRPDGRFDIFVDPSTTTAMTEGTQRHRARFRIAHEIAHSFFYDRRHQPAQRVLRVSDVEEAFCDRFASALLVPRTVAKALRPEPASVFKLRAKLDVSAQVAGRALAGAHSDASVIGMLHMANPATGCDPGWRVTWCAGPRFIPQNARLHSIAVAEAAQSGHAELVEKLSVGDAKGSFSVAVTLARGGGQMIAVLLPASVVSRKRHHS